MKILDIVEREDGFAEYITDVGKFVYAQDKFKSIDEVRTEIYRSRAKKTKLDKKKDRFAKVKSDFAKEKLKDAGNKN